MTNFSSCKKSKNGFADEQTNSTWNIAGKCIDGSLKGSKLKTEPHGNHFALSGLYFTRIQRFMKTEDNLEGDQGN